MPSIRSQRLALAAICLLAPLAGCAEPPTKELSQAQGAIDAARAAGAAEYAASELGAAEQSLASAHRSVSERDYRAALGHALDSSAQAQASAKAAVDGRVRARVEADRALADFATRVSRLQIGLREAEARRVPAPARKLAAAEAASAIVALQAARDSVERGDLSAVAALTAMIPAVDEAAAALGAPDPASRARKRP
jgi:hypothetical protein